MISGCGGARGPQQERGGARPGQPD